MKHTLILTTVFMLAFGFKGKAQADTLHVSSNPQTTFIRIIESGSYGLLNNVDSRMIIAGPDNQVKIKDLQRANYSMNANEGIEFNTKTIQAEMQKWQNMGFEVKSMTTAATRETVVITTIVMQKP